MTCTIEDTEVCRLRLPRLQSVLSAISGINHRIYNLKVPSPMMAMISMPGRDVRIADRSAGGSGSARVCWIRGYPRIHFAEWTADADYPRIQ
jgi:hypothetical protein